jgi:hypothetical protein
VQKSIRTVCSDKGKMGALSNDHLCILCDLKPYADSM